MRHSGITVAKLNAVKSHAIVKAVEVGNDILPSPEDFDAVILQMLIAITIEKEYSLACQTTRYRNFFQSTDIENFPYLANQAIDQQTST